MRQNSIPLMAVAFCFLLSCQKLTNSYDDLSVRCGPDASDAGTYHWVEVENMDGAKQQKALLAAGFKEDGTFKRLPVSSKGCVAIPQKSGDLSEFAIVLPGAPMQGIVLDPRSALRSARIHLAIVESQAMRIRCDEGDASAAALKDDLTLFYDGAGPHTSRRYRALVKILKDDATRLTSFVPLQSSSVSLSLKSLDEGEYALQAEAIDLFAIGDKSIVSSNRCVVKIDRQAPSIQLKPWDGFKIPLGATQTSFQVKSGQVLEYKVSDASVVEVFGCWVERASANESCQPFQKFNGSIRAPLDGIWQLQYYGVDQAGNRSAMTVVNFDVFNSEKVERILADIRELPGLIASDSMMPALEKITAILETIDRLSSIAEKQIFDRQLIPYLLMLQTRVLPRLGFSFNNVPLESVHPLMNTNFLVYLEGRYGSYARYEVRKKSGKLIGSADMGPCKHQIKRSIFLPQDELILNCEMNSRLVLRDGQLNVLDQVELDPSWDLCTDLIFTDDGSTGFITCRNFLGKIEISNKKVSLKKISDTSYQYLKKSSNDNLFINIDYHEKKKAVVYARDGRHITDLDESRPIDTIEGNRDGSILCLNHDDGTQCRSGSDQRDFPGVYSLAFNPLLNQMIYLRLNQAYVYDWDKNKERDLGEQGANTRLFFKGKDKIAVCQPYRTKLLEYDSLMEIPSGEDERCWANQIGQTRLCAVRNRYHLEVRDCATGQNAFPRLPLETTILDIAQKKDEVYVKTKDGRLEVLPRYYLTQPVAPMFPGNNGLLYAHSGHWIQANPDSLNFYSIRSIPAEANTVVQPIISRYSNQGQIIQLHRSGQPLILMAQNSELTLGSLRNAGQAKSVGFASDIVLVDWVASDRIAVLTGDKKMSLLDSELKTLWTFDLPEEFLNGDGPRLTAQLQQGVFALAGTDAPGSNALVLVFRLETSTPILEFHSKRMELVPEEGSVQTLKFSKDAKKLLIGFHVNAIMVLDVVASTLQKPVYVKLGSPQDTVFDADFLPGDRSAYHMSWDGTIALHDLDASLSKFLPTVQPLWRGGFLPLADGFATYSSEQDFELVQTKGNRLGVMTQAYDLQGLTSDEDSIYLLFEGWGLLPVDFHQEHYRPRLCKWLEDQFQLTGYACQNL